MKTHKGFTLVEILVVIAIIATVAAVAIPIGTRVYNNARATEAKTAMKQFDVAMNLYHQSHGSLNFGFDYTEESGFTSVEDPSDQTKAIATNNHDQLIAALTGDGDGTRTRVKYLKLQSATDPDSDSVANGITRDANNVAHGLLDPWGQPYYVQVDLDYDNIITLGSDAGSHANTVVNLGGSHYLLISKGADGTFGTDDDVFSYR